VIGQSDNDTKLKTVFLWFLTENKTNSVVTMTDIRVISTNVVNMTFIRTIGLKAL